MSSIPRFVERFGSGARYDAPTQAQIECWRGRLHDKILQEWSEHGWCSYGDGFFWFVDPALFESSIREWMTDQAVVFARTSFGHLLLAKDNGETFHLDVHRGDCTGYAYNPYRFAQYAMTGDVDFVDLVLDRSLHRQAIQKFGAPSPDEIFTFEPALALGGRAALECVAKVKMLPQLSILAQLNA